MISNTSSSIGVNANRDIEKLRQNVYNFKSTQYPENVDGDEGLGHYILFNINVVNESKFRSEYNSVVNTQSVKDAGGSGIEGLSPEAIEMLSKGQSAVLNLVGKAAGETFGLFGAEDVAKKITNTASSMADWATKEIQKIKLTDRTKRISEAIVLYMPETLETKYSNKWEETGFSGVTADVVSSILSFASGNGISDGKVNDLGLGALDMAAGFFDTFTPQTFNLKDLASITGQRVRNPHLEFKFTGINPREFSFNFKFIPANQHEVALVDDIINTFKFHAAPEIIGDDKAGSYYLYPSSFDITFMANKKENKRINKISTCVLTDIDVKYSDNEGPWTTFKPDTIGSMPVSTSLTLSFKETELITKEKIKEGY